MIKHPTGFLPEPPNPKHKSFEGLLRPRLMRPPLRERGFVDMRNLSLNRRDQGQTQSCVGQSVTKALEIREASKKGIKNVTPLSVLEVYYLAREIMFPKQTGWDSGTFISHACDAARRFGVCPEVDWPFDPSKINVPPSWAAMRHAYQHRAAAFYKIESTGDARVQMVREALANFYPVVIGTDVGDNWDEYEKGAILQVCPNPTGKHATTLIGDMDGNFIGENSWGENWGDKGFYLMDPAVIASNQTYECWVITQESE